MNCQSCREALTALLDQELSSEEQGSVESHIRACSDCREELESMRYAFALTERAESVPLNPAVWERIHSEIESLDSPGRGRMGRLVRSLLLPPRRVAVVAGIALAIIIILFVSFPINTPDRALEEEFTAYIQKREKISRENRRMLFENTQNGGYQESNPFVKLVSHPSTNPFRK